jgi:PEP-CTERM motif
MKRLLTTTAIVIGACYFGAPANAALIDFGFGNFLNTDLGVSATFSNGGASILAKAEGTAGHLWGKHLGGDENGLGTTGDDTGEHEIQAGHGYVQIDLAGLVGHILGATVSFGINSSTNGEQWRVWGTNTADLSASNLDAAHATLLDSGTNEFTSFGLNALGVYRYLDFVAIGTDHDGNKSNILIAAFTATPLAVDVPEPASLGLLGLGLLGTVAFARKRQS